MTTDSIPRSRRAILAAGAAAGAATVASALGRPSPASAAGPGSFDSAVAVTPAVVATHTAVSGVAFGVSATSASPDGRGVIGHATAATGQTYGVVGSTTSTSGRGVYGHADATTGVTYGVFGQADSVSGIGVGGYAVAASGFTKGVWGGSDSTDGSGVYGAASATSGENYGVYGRSASSGGRGVLGYAAAPSGATRGVHGFANSTDGAGVEGLAVGVGVLAHSYASHGVVATSGAANKAAILGRADGNSTGVIGKSGAGDPVSPSKTGVYGRATQDSNARGVHGYSTAGRGVFGQATTGVAGYFATPKPADAIHTGVALQAVGRVKFDRCAGVATIPVGQKSVVVDPGIDLVLSSAVVATLMGSAGGTTNVHRVSVNATTNAFAIYLTASNTAASPVKVAWHVFG